MDVRSTPEFKKTFKKLNSNQRRDLVIVIEELRINPMLGTLKTGDLSHVRVYKFRMNKQLTLLGYKVEDDFLRLILIKVGPHENFYRDLQRDI